MTIDSTLRKAFLQPRSVALVGASPDLKKNNSRRQRFLQRFGYTGKRSSRSKDMALSLWMDSLFLNNRARAYARTNLPSPSGRGVGGEVALPRLTTCLLLVAVGTATVPAAYAADKRAAPVDDYPSKPVRFISPFSAGGGTDTVARALAQRLSEAMGRTFVVDNRGGADGVIGTELGARSPADGYTLLVANLGTFSLTPNLRKVPYDPLRDFAPITQTTASSTVLVVNPSFPVNSVKELVALAKAKPGQINFGSSSNGTALPMEMLKLMAGINLNRVPYKGTGPALIGIISGEVPVMFGGAINTVPQVKSGKLRALAVAGDRRAQALPNVPTVAESGFPGYEANSWNGIVAPAGTPRHIVSKLNAAMVKVLQMPEVREFMTADGAEPAYNTPEQFTAFLRADHAKWARVIKTAGLKETQ